MFQSQIPILNRKNFTLGPSKSFTKRVFESSFVVDGCNYKSSSRSKTPLQSIVFEYWTKTVTVKWSCTRTSVHKFNERLYRAQKIFLPTLSFTAKKVGKRCCCGMMCPIIYLRKISFFQIHFCHFDRDKELFLFFVKMKSKPRPLQKASCVKCLHEDSYSNLFIKSNINTVSNSRDNSVCFTKDLPQCF